MGKFIDFRLNDVCDQIVKNFDKRTAVKAKSDLDWCDIEFLDGVQRSFRFTCVSIDKHKNVCYNVIVSDFCVEDTKRTSKCKKYTRTFSSIEEIVCLLKSTIEQIYSYYIQYFLIFVC